MQSVRQTVLFESEEAWRAGAEQNATAITVHARGGEVVQTRRTWAAAGGPRVRVTWSGGRTVSEVSPQLAAGLSVYVEGGAHVSRDFVQARGQAVFHSAQLELDAVRAWWPRELAVQPEALRWAECAYDIELGRQVRVDEYCALRAGETVALTAAAGGTDEAKVETGVFYPEISDGADVSLSGFRCTWLRDGSGRTDTCQKTLLMYKPAHVHMPEPAVGIELVQPVTLHPVIEVDLSSVSASGPACAHHVFLQLPAQLFVDKFQQPPELLFGEDDLELPEYKVEAWGSEVIYALEPGRVNRVQLHSRYARPGPGRRYEVVPLRPYVFEACDTGSADIAENPFYSKGMGFEAYFTADTVFKHRNSTRLNIPVPRGNSNDFPSIQYVTVLSILFSVLYISYCLFRRPVAASARASG
uniref:Protein PBN1 n=2 Tax=Eremothecium gossypii (strain ATCC 10895 / CBS 109.51 / FGSC 9923 / NRRL Y-1056) TaxID=284811 RepID=PBN1_EREGS|nr:RecName: Full=Protein PBN1 [Eremothecium gossypii ATCC 10895]